MSKEVDQNKLRRKGEREEGRGEGAVWQEGGGKAGGVRDNFKYHLCPSVKRGVGMARPCRKTCLGGGSEVSVRAGAQWGQGGVGA